MSQTHVPRAWVLPFEDATAIVTLEGDGLRRSAPLGCPSEASSVVDVEADLLAWARDERVFIARGHFARDVMYSAPIVAPGTVRALALRDSTLFAAVASPRAPLLAWDVQSSEPKPLDLGVSLDAWWGEDRALRWAGLGAEGLVAIAADQDGSNTQVTRFELVGRHALRVAQRATIAAIGPLEARACFALSHDALWVLSLQEPRCFLRGYDLRTLRERQRTSFDLPPPANAVLPQWRGFRTPPEHVTQLSIVDERALLRCPKLGIAALDLRAIDGLEARPLRWQQPFAGRVLGAALASASEAIVSYERRSGDAALARWTIGER